MREYIAKSKYFLLIAVIDYLTIFLTHKLLGKPLFTNFSVLSFIFPKLINFYPHPLSAIDNLVEEV